MKRLAVAFSGPSNSGKTTLICKVAKRFIDDGLKVVIIKHDPKDKAIFDTVGKDSFKFNSLGADTIVVSPTRTTMFSHTTSNLKELIEMAGEFDMLIIEGLKTFDLPRITLFRESVDESYLPVSNAIATNLTLSKDYKLPVFDINDDKNIAKWVLDNAKKV